MSSTNNEKRNEEHFHRRELAGFVQIYSGEIGVVDPKRFDQYCREKRSLIRGSVSEHFSEIGASVPEIDTRLGPNPVFIRRNNSGEATRIMVDFRETKESIEYGHRTKPLVRFMKFDEYLDGVSPPDSRFMLVVDPLFARSEWNKKGKDSLGQAMKDHEFRSGVVTALGGLIVKVQDYSDTAQIRRCYDWRGNQTGIEFCLDQPIVKQEIPFPWMADTNEP